MREIMQGYRKGGLCAAAVISAIPLSILFIYAIVSGNYATLGQVWWLGIPWSLCPSIAMMLGKARVNAEILYPKGMKLQCHGCFAHEIVGGARSLESGSVAAQVDSASAVEAQSVEAFEEKSQPESVSGRKERERAPANYGTVELTHSSKNDVCEDVVRSIYTHIGNGAARSERITVCNVKIVYVPEEDLVDLAQVYNSTQMGELRAKAKGEDGVRRVLRFFFNNGTSLAASSE